jgi:hypothetical protein
MALLTTETRDAPSRPVSDADGRLAALLTRIGSSGLPAQLRNADVFKVINAVAVATETTIWTPAAGKKFRVMGFLLALSAGNGNVVLRDNTAGAIIAVVPALTNVPVVPSPPEMGNGILSAAANNVLTATGIAASVLSGFVFGTEE